MDIIRLHKNHPYLGTLTISQIITTFEQTKDRLTHHLEMNVDTVNALICDTFGEIIIRVYGFPDDTHKFVQLYFYELCSELGLLPDCAVAHEPWPLNGIEDRIKLLELVIEELNSHVSRETF